MIESAYGHLLWAEISFVPSHICNDLWLADDKIVLNSLSSIISLPADEMNVSNILTFSCVKFPALQFIIYAMKKQFSKHLSSFLYTIMKKCIYRYNISSQNFTSWTIQLLLLNTFSLKLISKHIQLQILPKFQFP
jgi:hypothetical protein